MAEQNVVLEDTEDVKARALDRYYTLKRTCDDWARTMWFGALIGQFTSEELQLICEHFSIGDTLDLRRVGVLAPGQGYDGAKQGRKR